MVTMKKFSCLMGALAIVVITTWFITMLRIPEAREMAVKIQVLQRRADDALDSQAIRLNNRLAALRWLGRFMPNPVLPHSEACTAPSVSMRFLPLVGEALLALRYAEYSLCMERLLFRAKIARMSMLCVECVAGILVLAIMLLLRRCARALQQHLRNILSQKAKESDKEKDSEKRKETEDNEEFLRHRVPFISEVALLNLGPGRHLDTGGFGSVKKVTY